MSIETSITSIAGFLQRNDGLIQEITETGKNAADTLKGLFKRLLESRDEAQELVEKIEAGHVKFAVSADKDMKEKQRIFLEEIGNVGKKIQLFQEEEDLVGLLQAQQAALYLGLANTYNDTVKMVVTFTEGEIDELNVLLRRASLDKDARKRQADILDASIQLSKLALRVATKLAMA
ncbi:MAG: hypothetical protein ACREJU_14540 [Nitrospiraceae bacterium]